MSEIAAATANPPLSSSARRHGLLVRAAVALLLVVGLGASVLRATYTSDLGARLEPLRDRALEVAGVRETNPVRRADAVRRIDSKFASHRERTLLHVVTGGVMLTLVPLQFATRGRAPYRALHRWSGRAVAVAAATAGLSGLYFGVVVPFAGNVERAIIAPYGLYFLSALGIGWAHIRAHRTAKHREWMIRMVTAALGISMVRLLALPFDIMLTQWGAGPEPAFLLSLATGLTLSIAGGELWVRSSPERGSPAGVGP